MQLRRLVLESTTYLNGRHVSCWYQKALVSQSNFVREIT
jgi:hypothetical protein